MAFLRQKFLTVKSDGRRYISCCQTAKKHYLSPIPPTPQPTPPTPMGFSVIAEYEIIFVPNTASTIAVWLSLVPRPALLSGHPGTHCSRMRVIKNMCVSQLALNLARYLLFQLTTSRAGHKSAKLTVLKISVSRTEVRYALSTLCSSRG